MTADIEVKFGLSDFSIRRLLQSWYIVQSVRGAQYVAVFSEINLIKCCYQTCHVYNDALRVLSITVINTTVWSRNTNRSYGIAALDFLLPEHNLKYYCLKKHQGINSTFDHRRNVDYIRHAYVALKSKLIPVRVKDQLDLKSAQYLSAPVQCLHTIHMVYWHLILWQFSGKPATLSSSQNSYRIHISKRERTKVPCCNVTLVQAPFMSVIPKKSTWSKQCCWKCDIARVEKT